MAQLAGRARLVAAALAFHLAAAPPAGAVSPALAARIGTIATAHPLASAAGLEIMVRGGNAVDAAVAAAAVLGVVEPGSSGPAGSGFLILYWAEDRQVRVLEFTGTAPALAPGTPYARATALRGPLAPTVPGAVGGWAEAIRAHGRLPLATVLEPAIRHAADGFPLSPRVHRAIQESASALAPEAASLFLPGGRPPDPGTPFRQPDLAWTLREIAAGGPEAFYRGEVGRRLVAILQARGGILDAADLAAYRPRWVKPLTGKVAGLTVATVPPPGAGLVVLELLQALEGEDLRGLGHNSPALIHRQVEAFKLAMADFFRFVADPAFAPPLPPSLLSPEAAAERRHALSRSRALPGIPALGTAETSQTTTVAAADAGGNMAVLTTSLISAFGSGLLVPGTGLLLNNEMVLFSVGQAGGQGLNGIAAGKRPATPIAPTLFLHDGRPVLALGGAGAYAIPQAIAQVAVNVTGFGMPLREAIAAPRFAYAGPGGILAGGARLYLEDGIPAATAAGLAALGHQVVQGEAGRRHTAGTVQALAFDRGRGVVEAAADVRREGLALGR